MPELPEVETVRRGLQATVEGYCLTYVETRRRDLRVPFPDDFENRLTARRVQRLWRRAKYIMADLDGGETLVTRTVPDLPSEVNSARFRDRVSAFEHSGSPLV